MIRHRLLSFVMLLPLWAALSGVALAQNPTNGKTLYDTFCSGCHGTNPATNKDNVLNGKTYSGLVTAWTVFKTDMPYLFPSKVFTKKRAFSSATRTATGVTPCGLVTRDR